MTVTDQYTATFCALDDFLTRLWSEQEQRDPAVAAALKESAEGLAAMTLSAELSQMNEAERLISTLARMMMVALELKSGVSVAERMTRHE